MVSVIVVPVAHLFHYSTTLKERNIINDNHSLIIDVLGDDSPTVHVHSVPFIVAPFHRARFIVGLFHSSDGSYCTFHSTK